MREYDLVFSQAAAQSFAALSKARQRGAAVALETLRGSPFKSGDYQQRADDGRWHEVHLFGAWMVTSWTDHAVREIRVMELERGDEGH